MGDKQYYSNYFLDAVDMTESQKNSVQSQIKSYNPTTDQGRSTTLVWSYLDTSVPELDIFGIEILSFTDYQLVIDFSSYKGYSKDQISTIFDCQLTVASKNSEQQISVPFKIKVENTPYIIGFNDAYFISSSSSGSSGNLEDYVDSVQTNLQENQVPTAKKENIIPVQTFSAYTSIKNFEMAFSGQVINTAIKMNEDDIKNATILVSNRFQNYGEISKILRCSRLETIVKDVVIAETGSIYVLTDQSILKIKNATTYSVQNQMKITSAGEQSGVTSSIKCHKILLNEAKNLLISICDKFQIPYLVLSNWNSIKPSNSYEKQMSFQDIGQVQSSFIDNMSVYIFAKPLNQGVQTSTEFQKLELGVGETLNIQFTQQVSQSLEDVISNIDHLVFPPKSGSETSGNQNYFVALSSDLTNPKSAKLILYEDSSDEVQKGLVSIFSETFFDMLGKQESMLEKFSEISTLKCVNEADNRHFNDTTQLIGQTDNSIYFSCLISQTRNYHFEINFKLDGKSVEIKTNKGYAGYGDFTTLGSIDMDSKYVATLITKTNFGLKNTFEGEAENNLATSYVVVYNRTVSIAISILISRMSQKAAPKFRHQLLLSSEEYQCLFL